jgi:hypothetical protein
MILNDVLEHIGNTPMVKMESVKAEFRMTDRLMDELFAQVRVDRLASEYGIACNLCRSIHIASLRLLIVRIQTANAVRRVT